MSAASAPGLCGKRILVTGPTGQVGLPIALALAARNEVWGIARFSAPAERQRLEQAGVTCVVCDLATSDFRDLPTDFDYVLNFAVARGGNEDWDRDLAANGEAVGLLVAHCRGITAFFHCSSTAVYEPAGTHPLRETDALGDSHRSMFPTYSIAKIVSEVAARTAAREYGVPTVIARLNVPYGDNGGWPWYHLQFMRAGQAIPLHPDRPNLYNPIHEDDLIRHIPRLLEVASVPATIVNWAGAQTSTEEWCGYLGELTGLEPAFEETSWALPSITIDTTRMHELIGPAEVDWHDGFRRMVQARMPSLLRG